MLRARRVSRPRDVNFLSLRDKPLKCMYRGHSNVLLLQRVRHASRPRPFRHWGRFCRCASGYDGTRTL